MLTEGSQEVEALREEQYATTRSGSKAKHVSGVAKNPKTAMTQRGTKNVFKNPDDALNLLNAIASNPGIKMSEGARKKINALYKKQQTKKDK